MLGSRAVDFALSSEHELLRRTVRDFATREVEPVVEAHERERRFPRDVVRRIGEMGWLGIPFPEKEGGAGLDTLAYAVVVEELARVWGSLALIVAAHTSLGCNPIHVAGTPDQKRRFLAPMARGDVLGAYGLTEPEAGSDSGGTKTTARLEDGPDGSVWSWGANNNAQLGDATIAWHSTPYAISNQLAVKPRLEGPPRGARNLR